MFEYFDAQPNSYFIDFIIGNDNSFLANLHREVYFSEINHVGKIYYSLGKKYRKKALNRAIAEVGKDVLLKKIDIDSLNLHLYLYEVSKKYFAHVKRELMLHASDKKCQLKEQLMDDIIISQERILDNVLFEGKTYAAFITIGLVKGNNFWLKLEFDNLCLTDFTHLYELSGSSKAIEIRSDIIAKENYNIQQIVITNHVEDDLGFIIWECLSNGIDTINFPRIRFYNFTTVLFYFGRT